MWKRAWLIGVALGLSLVAGCGGGRYGYGRTYEAWGDEGQYL